MSLFNRIKAKLTGTNATSAGGQSYQSIMATLVAAQTATSFGEPIEAFPTILDDLKAQGYLFGFHYAFAKHLYGQKPDKCLSEIRASYAVLFGQQPGHFLFDKVIVDQETP